VREPNIDVATDKCNQSDKRFPSDAAPRSRPGHRFGLALTCLWALLIAPGYFYKSPAVSAKPDPISARAAYPKDKPEDKVHVDDRSFRCMTEMTPVRHFYVDNLLGNLDATLAVAKSETGGAYPPGSVVQLVPTEVMVKHEAGFNPTTRDWEFLELDVSKDGSTIRKRGFAEVINRFGGNCFTCHVRARPQWDLICETGHGCDPIPLTRAMSGALQRTDPRCKNSKPISPEDAKALQQLGELLKSSGSTTKDK
jgi:hypothetical protein